MDTYAVYMQLVDLGRPDLASAMLLMSAKCEELGRISRALLEGHSDVEQTTTHI